MRKKEKEIKDNSLIKEILEKSEICRLGMVDNDEAYIVPVNYGYEDGVIYIHSAPEGRKIELIKRNNRVSFEIEYSGEVIKSEIPCRWTTRYRSVMGTGTIVIENDTESKKKRLDVIMHKYGAGPDLIYNDADLLKMVILKLKIESISGKQSGVW